MFQSTDPISPNSFEDTSFVWVDTPVSFNIILETLRNAKEVTVDLEYHSDRTFAGFVCFDAD